MTTRSTTILMALGGSLLVAGAASAQSSVLPSSAQDRARSVTQSLNSAPADTVLRPRMNAQPPLSQGERAPPAPSPTVTQDSAETIDPSAPPSMTLAPGQTEPEAMAIAMGYYVRGDKPCDEVEAGQGDLAWLSATAFTLDFGGCEPGEFQQTGPNVWTEQQRCETELGGDAGVYDITYRLVAPNTLTRDARVAFDGRVEQDVWRYCHVDDLPVSARFNS